MWRFGCLSSNVSYQHKTSTQRKESENTIYLKKFRTVSDSWVQRAEMFQERQELVPTIKLRFIPNLLETQTYLSHDLIQECLQPGWHLGIGGGGISIVKCFCYVDLMPTVLHTVDHKMIKAHMSRIILQENRNTVWKSWCSQVWTQSEISNRLIACNYYSCIVHLSTLEDQNKRRIHADKVHDKPLLHIHQFYFLQQNRDECNTLTYGNTGQRNILLTEEQTLKKGRRINHKHMISHYIPEDDKQNQVWNYLTLKKGTAKRGQHDCTYSKSTCWCLSACVLSYHGLVLFIFVTLTRDLSLQSLNFHSKNLLISFLFLTLIKIWIIITNNINRNKNLAKIEELR